MEVTFENRLYELVFSGAPLPPQCYLQKTAATVDFGVPLIDASHKELPPYLTGGIPVPILSSVPVVIPVEGTTADGIYVGPTLLRTGNYLWMLKRGKVQVGADEVLTQDSQGALSHLEKCFQAAMPPEPPTQS